MNELVVLRCVGATEPSLALVSKKLAAGEEVEVAATEASEVVEMTAGVVGETISGVVDVEEILDDVLEETMAADVDVTVPEEPKLLDAVVEAPLLTSTLFTITISPSTLVIFTSTVVVPNPLEFSKKL